MFRDIAVLIKRRPVSLFGRVKASFWAIYAINSFGATTTGSCVVPYARRVPPLLCFSMYTRKSRAVRVELTTKRMALPSFLPVVPSCCLAVSRKKKVSPLFPSVGGDR